MMKPNFNTRSVDNNRFAMIPRADIPRSKYRTESAHKTTFNAGLLIPIYVDEVLPGDHHSVSMTAFARLSTPVFPLMDNLHLDSFFFFVPNRLLWANWKRFMGEQPTPASSIDFEIPPLPLESSNVATTSIFAYMGIPTGMLTGVDLEVNALPFRAYNLIWNEWFRDQNLQDSITVTLGDGPDSPGYYTLKRRNKRHDYFTSCLPFAQKGDAVSIPLVGTAPVSGIGIFDESTADVGVAVQDAYQGASAVYGFARVAGGVGTSRVAVQVPDGSDDAIPSIYADLSGTTAATINQLRLAFQIQKLLERNARGGTRYTEIIRAHFGIVSPDARMQRPEFLGGGSTPMNITPIAQQSGTGASGTTSALGTLAAIGTAVASGHRFSYAATEHGYIIGLVNVRADLTYQQGVHRMWSRKTRYDFYWPAFAHLGEQAVLRKELYVTGVSADDETVFGYQERWAEYRYMPSRISGRFSSNASTPLDAWHLAQDFSSPPVLGDSFMQDTPPMSRVLALGATATDRGQEIIFDSVFTREVTRCMPTYSVPQLIDHF